MPGSSVSFRISFGRLGGDLFDLHAARRRSHEDRLALHAVEHDAQVQFAFDGQRLFDQQPLHDAAFGPVWCVTSVMPSILRAMLGGFRGILAPP